MHLLRWRPLTKTVKLELPDGSTRNVKVTENDIATTQHVEDGDVVHGTGRPIAIGIVCKTRAERRAPLAVLRDVGMPKMRQAFERRPDFEGIWAPVHGSEQLR